MSKVYLNSKVITELGLNVLGKPQMLPLKEHAEGLIGAIMVFETEEQAKAYADVPVLELDCIQTKAGDAVL